MKALTLRNLPPELGRIIRRTAAQKRTSLNQAVISLLGRHVGTQGKKEREPLHHDLDALAGSWSKEEARAFERALAKQRDIDPDMWK